jgi:hypothetical protein
VPIKRKLNGNSKNLYTDGYNSSIQSTRKSFATTSPRGTKSSIWSSIRKHRKNDGFCDIDDEDLDKAPLYIYENGSSYTGQWNRYTNVKDGYGIEYHISGAKYQGYWKDDVYHGYGILVHENGDIYDGDFRFGVASGFGILTEISGTKYEGNWDSNLRHG